VYFQSFISLIAFSISSFVNSLVFWFSIAFATSIALDIELSIQIHKFARALHQALVSQFSI